MWFSTVHFNTDYSIENCFIKLASDKIPCLVQVFPNFIVFRNSSIVVFYLKGKKVNVIYTETNYDFELKEKKRNIYASLVQSLLKAFCSVDQIKSVDVL